MVAVRIARAATGRSRVLFSGYHRWHDWYIAANLGEVYLRQGKRDEAFDCERKAHALASDVPAPGENILATLKLGVYLMRQGEYISDHEVKIGNKVAEVLCGGNVSPGTPVSEQYLLDLEREGFKSLCGERKTQERIQYTLKTGKTLRN